MLLGSPGSSEQANLFNSFPELQTSQGRLIAQSRQAALRLSMGDGPNDLPCPVVIKEE